mmetsp:Transcript_20382/g.46806  ORF Transcript_20382/g.46806 Transcript_20382/m.46806 type:complete len:211 (-) Transcript_20382:108-740(-)
MLVIEFIELKLVKLEEDEALETVLVGVVQELIELLLEVVDDVDDVDGLIDVVVEGDVGVLEPLDNKLVELELVDGDEEVSLDVELELELPAEDCVALVDMLVCDELVVLRLDLGDDNELVEDSEVILECDVDEVRLDDLLDTIDAELVELKLELVGELEELELELVDCDVRLEMVDCEVDVLSELRLDDELELEMPEEENVLLDIEAELT